MSNIEDEKKGDVYTSANHLEYEEKAQGVISDNFGQYINDAADSSAQQKGQTIRDAVRMYPMGIVFSLIFSTAIIMEGYDTLLLGQFYAQPAFAARFGFYDAASKSYQIPAQWQTALGAGGQVGQILGLQITGWASDRFGYRKTMAAALVAITGLLFLQFFASGLPMLLIAYILLGFPFGTFQTMTVAYASELMPVALRPILTTYVNLCWVIGQIIASGVNLAFIGDESEWAYKIPFAIQWIWPVPIMIGIFFAPESPWFLVRKGKLEEAERCMLKITSRAHYSVEDARKAVAMMVHTNEIEKEVMTGTSYRDCFRGINFRRTEIACIVWLIQTTCGSPLMGQGTYFLVQAGLSAKTASTLNLCMFAVGACGTIASWPLMKVAGRRTLYLYGQVALFALMLLTGILGSVNLAAATPSSGASYAIGAFLIMFTGLYDLTVGPVCYCLVAEIGSTRLRAKTVVLARNLYNLGGVVVNVLNPQMLNPTAWNLGARSGYLWAMCGLVGIVWTFFRLPEPKGRTFGELDILFEERVPARHFSRTQVDEFKAAERNAASAALGGGAMVH